MKIAPVVGVLLHSRRARGTVLKFLSPAAKFALALVATLLLYWLLVFGLRWAGYDAYDHTISTWLAVGILVFALYQRVMSYKGPHGWE